MADDLSMSLRRASQGYRGLQGAELLRACAWSGALRRQAGKGGELAHLGQRAGGQAVPVEVAAAVCHAALDGAGSAGRPTARKARMAAGAGQGRRQGLSKQATGGMQQEGEAVQRRPCTCPHRLPVGSASQAAAPRRSGAGRRLAARMVEGASAGPAAAPELLPRSCRKWWQGRTSGRSADMAKCLEEV